MNVNDIQTKVKEIISNATYKCTAEKDGCSDYNLSKSHKLSCKFIE